MRSKLSSLFSEPRQAVAVSDKHRRRMKTLVLFGSGLVITLGLGWGSYYALRGKALLIAMSFSLAAVGFFALACGLKDRIRLASMISVHVLLAVICAFCMLDVPLANVPRSAHMHLLSLAAGAFLLFRGEGRYLRVGLPLACFLACLYFAGSRIGVDDRSLLPPDEVRTVGVWINNATCFLTLAMILWIMQADVTVRNAIEADLRTAIAQGQFLLHYQPQVGEDGRIIGAEALLRWEHPQRGMIPPGKFIPLAEETGLIVPIGDWVLRKACAQLVAWAAHPSTAGLTLSVNVSASQFRQPDFVQQVLEIVERSGAQPARLKLELTESMLVKDVEEVIQKMSQLKACGVGFSLDDFGTGYSSLSYLKRLPLDQLKIDQSFVRDLLTDPSDMAIVRTLVSLGRSMNLMLIAEGVETEGQHAWLRDNDCCAYQGYLFSKPLPAAQFEALAAGGRTPVAANEAAMSEPAVQAH